MKYLTTRPESGKLVDMPATGETHIQFEVTATVRCGVCHETFKMDVDIDMDAMPEPTEVEIYGTLPVAKCPTCDMPLDAHLSYDDPVYGPQEAQSTEFVPYARSCPPKATDEIKYPVAVYGTLRDGWGNASWSWKANGRESLGLRVLADHRLITRGHGSFPYCVPCGGHSSVVELIDVDEITLHQFDVLEGTAARHYDRAIVTLTDGTEAWIYLAGPWYYKDIETECTEVPLNADGVHDWDCVGSVRS